MTQAIGYPILPSPSGGSVEGLYLWAIALVGVLTPYLTRSAVAANTFLDADGNRAMRAPLTLMTFTTSNRPAAADWKGAVIFVSDGGAGAVFQGSDGTSWVNLG